MLEIRKGEWTASLSQEGYQMLGCPLIEFSKFHGLLYKGKLKNIGFARRTFRVISNLDGDLFLRIEGEPGVCLIPITAQPEDIDADS